MLPSKKRSRSNTRSWQGCSSSEGSDTTEDSSTPRAKKPNRKKRCHQLVWSSQDGSSFKSSNRTKNGSILEVENIYSDRVNIGSCPIRFLPSDHAKDCHKG